nr:MAG TPA: hypothetical protein [Caudoviricetes sp.]
MFCLSHNVERKLIWDAKSAHVVVRQRPNWNISKKAFTTKACLAVLCVNTGQKDCLKLAICELIATPAIRVVLNGRVRHMKTNNNKAYIFGQRKAGAEEIVLSQEELDEIKKIVKSIRGVPIDTLKPACSRCINLAECLANVTDPNIVVKCIWYGWLLKNKENLGG